MHRDTRSLGLSDDIRILLRIEFRDLAIQDKSGHPQKDDPTTENKNAGRMPALQHGLKAETPRGVRGAGLTEASIPQE